VRTTGIVVDLAHSTHLPEGRKTAREVEKAIEVADTERAKRGVCPDERDLEGIPDGQPAGILPD